MNQYWYSPNTIKRIVEDIEEQGGRVAFLSTPSLYFSVSAECRARSKIFDVSTNLTFICIPYIHLYNIYAQFDRKWETDPGFIFYDFNNPDGIHSDLDGTFELAVIDPPFITKEVSALIISEYDCSSLAFVKAYIFVRSGNSTRLRRKSSLSEKEESSYVQLSQRTKSFYILSQESKRRRFNQASQIQYINTVYSLTTIPEHSLTEILKFRNESF